MNACLEPGFERQSGGRFSYHGQSSFADSSHGLFENTYIYSVYVYMFIDTYVLHLQIQSGYKDLETFLKNAFYAEQ